MDFSAAVLVWPLHHDITYSEIHDGFRGFGLVYAIFERITRNAGNLFSISYQVAFLSS